MAVLCVTLVLALLSTALYSQGQEAGEEEVIESHHVYLLGERYPISPESPEVLDMAREYVDDFNSKSRSKKLFRLLNVTAAERQVTNVIKYTIHATIGKTKCLKAVVSNKESCDFGRKHRSCVFETDCDPRIDECKLVSSECTKGP